MQCRPQGYFPLQPRGPVQDHSWVMNSALTTVIGAQVLPICSAVLGSFMLALCLVSCSQQGFISSWSHIPKQVQRLSDSIHSPCVRPRPLQRAPTDFFPRLIGHRHVTGTGNGTVVAGCDSCHSTELGRTRPVDTHI